MKKLIFAFLMLPSLAFSNCQEVDLNYDTPIKDMEIHDQGNVGLCYGYVAAQMLDYELRKDKIDLKPSALHMGAEAAGRFGRSIESNEVNIAFNSAVSKGIVDNDCVEKSIREYTLVNKVTSQQYGSILEKIHQNESSFTKDADELVEMKEKFKNEYDLRECNFNPILDDLFSKGLWGTGAPEIVKKTVINCPRRSVPAYQMERIDKGNDDALIWAMENVLDRRKPAAVSLCNESIKNQSLIHEGGLRGLPIVRDHWTNVAKCSPHAVMVTGKRKKGNQCEYLIRNSWGAAWQPGLSCACKTKEKYYQDCLMGSEKDWTKAQKEQFAGKVVVGCWFTKEALAPNIMSIEAVK